MKSKKPKCKHCYDKKFYSVYVGQTIGAPDFIGDKRYLFDEGGIKQKPCPTCNKREGGTNEKTSN